MLRGKPDTWRRSAHNQGAESHRGRLNFSSRRVRFTAQGKKRREVEAGRKPSLESSELDDDVYYYTCWRLKLEGETENMGVCTKEREGVAAEILMAASCTLSHKLSRK